MDKYKAVLYCFILHMSNKKRPKTFITNQYTAPDPRQALFLSYFLDQKSESFSKIMQSGIRAGFSEEYSKNLMSLMPKWLSNSIEDTSLLDRAVRNLSETLDLKEEVQAMGAFGPIFAKQIKIEKFKDKKGKIKTRNKIEKVPVMVINPKLLKIKTDVSQFIAETVGRSRFAQSKSGAAFNGPVQFNFGADREKYQ